MSGVVDFDDPKANMYGCYPCPQCGSERRASYKRGGMVECDECGFREPVVERALAAGEGGESG